MVRDYITYDEIEDVLTSTDLLALLGPKLNKEPAFWKWAIIAAQNGLQGALVCALDDGVGVSVLTGKSARAVLAWHANRSGDYPPERLADFWTLFKRFCRSPQTRQQKLTRLQIKDIFLLHRHFRNNFEHFTPKTWSIEKAGLPRIIGTALDFIECAMRQDKVTRRLTGNKTRRLQENLHEARVSLQSLKS